MEKTQSDRKKMCQKRKRKTSRRAEVDVEHQNKEKGGGGPADQRRVRNRIGSLRVELAKLFLGVH